jgi:hypothetical protein
MTTEALRKELLALIDVLPVPALRAIKPLLKYLAESERVFIHAPAEVIEHEENL